MESIRFDFNNMFSLSVGDNGVKNEDIAQLSGDIRKAHNHLEKVLTQDSSRIRLGLEWVDLPHQTDKLINSIQRTGNKIVEKYDNVIFLGIGGSYLGLKAAQDALMPAYFNEFATLRKRRPRIYFEGNNLDSDTLKVLLKNLNPKKTFAVVISKSGETIETKAAFMTVENWLKKNVGKNYGRAVFVITDLEGGSLRKRVNAEQKKDQLSFRSLPLLKGVGGRYSEFNMGLLHLAILGVSIKEVFSGAKDMAKRCRREELFQNPAYMYASLHYLLYRKQAKNIAVIMPFAQGLRSSADWYVQLLAESLGKKYSRQIEVSANGVENWLKDENQILNTGRTPIPTCGTGDLHSVQQNNIEGENNKVVTFIKVDSFKNKIKVSGKGDILSGRSYLELMNLAREATEWALVREGRPSCTIIMPEVSAYHWGALLFFFQIATAFEGELLNVNAFDQPGVESYKNYMYYKLGKPGISQAVAEEIKNKPLIKDPKYIL